MVITKANGAINPAGGVPSLEGTSGLAMRDEQRFVGNALRNPIWQLGRKSV